MSSLLDLTGQRFGRLLVLSRAPRTTSAHQARWLCRCDCGATTTVISQGLRSGGTRSCGCLHREAAAARATKPLSERIFRSCLGCGKSFRVSPSQTRQWCSPKCFYQRSGTPEERFWRHVEKTPGCWRWTGATTNGYGIVYLGDRKHEGAHRFSYRLHVGSIPDGCGVLHRCDNPPCCNPDHLFTGTNQANMADRHAKGRDARGDRNGSRIHPGRLPRGERSPRAKLTDAQVLEIRRRYAEGEMQRDLAPVYGVSRSLIQAIVGRKVWKHLS